MTHDIRDYGARCGIDATSAVQAAVDAAKDGDTVLIPDGVWEASVPEPVSGRER